MKYCVAFGCKNTSRAGKQNNIQDKKLTFHIFPREESVRQVWVKSLRFHKWKPSPHSALCSEHFAEECFDRTSPFKVSLKPGSVPTIFPGLPIHLQPALLKKRRILQRKLPEQPQQPAEQPHRPAWQPQQPSEEPAEPLPKMQKPSKPKIDIKDELLNNICRLCLQKRGDLVKFPECYYMGDNISEILERYTLVRVVRNDNPHLPQQICSACLTSLIEVHNFITRCNESESLLSKLVEADYVIANDGEEEEEFTLVFGAIKEEVVVDDVKVEEVVITNVGDKEEMTIPDSCDEVTLDLTPVVVAKKEPFKQPKVKKKPAVVKQKVVKRQRAPKLRTAPKCTLCTEPVVFESFLLLRRHKQKVHGVGSALCNVCGKAFPGQWSLAQHMFAHSKEKNFTCDVCGANFRYIKNMHRHRALHTGAPKYFCECGKAFTQNSSLKTHKLTHIIKRSECNICGHVTMNCASHRTHMARHRRGVIDNQNSIIKSVTKNLDPDKFVCKYCKIEFESSAQLQQHFSEEHRDKMHLCPHCGKEFKAYANFYQHVRSHTSTKRFKCRYCDKVFSQSQSRIRHEHLHLGTRPYKCAQCNGTFVQQQHLKQHMLIHTGEKPHSCRHCGKSFRFKGNLIVHTRTHTGERPYVCTTCNTGFHHSSTLKKHYIKKCCKVESQK